MTTPSSPPDRTALVGSTSKDFWLYSSQHGWDLTHPQTPDSPPKSPRVTIQTTTQSITLHPPSTVLVIIDMQNFFLSTALGRSPDSPGLAAQAQLLEHAIPAATKAGIQIVFLNWGLTEQDMLSMPPATIKAFGFHSTTPSAGTDNDTQLENAGKNPRQYVGLGQDLRPIQLPASTDSESTQTVDAGRLLFQDTWNASLTPELSAVHTRLEAADSGSSPQPDGPPTRSQIIHKNRLDGLWGCPSGTSFGRFLMKWKLKTLLFAGVNTDQCVAATLMSAFTLGYDCILLKDGSATSSGKAAQESVERNCEGTYGFVTTCGWLTEGVERMER